MTPAEFRRDPWLRTSASHLATWSFAALALDLLARSGAGTPRAVRVSAIVGVVAGSLLTSMTTERRIAKMVGPAGDSVYERAGQLWTIVLATLVAATFVLVALEQRGALMPMWLGGVGAAFVFWGRKTRFDWYVILGGAMFAFAVFDLLFAAGTLRIVVLGVLLPVAAMAANRQYLWLRAEDDAGS